MLDRRDFMGALAAGGALAPSIGQAAPLKQRSASPATFTPDWASLTSGYRAPSWFRDAKFGIWAHWSAQCVPEEGDWYARNMYMQGSRAYKAHVARYGHPTTSGYIDIVGKWQAERWSPDRLMDLFVKAGARYF